jgi:hypothetical protein
MKTETNRGLSLTLPLRNKFSLLIFGLATILSACSKESESTGYIPIYSSNQTCVNNYLHKVDYLKTNEDMKLKQLPFDTNMPNPVIGFLEMKPEKNGDIQLIYNGIRTFCYPNTVQKTSGTNDEWQTLAKDIKLISNGEDAEFDNVSPLYVEVDLKNKNYSIYQSRAELKKEDKQ